MVYVRRRGTAIVESASGILVVSKDGRVFTLPGGGARPEETDREAAVRELKEETALDATAAVYLFEFLGQTHTGPRGGIFRNIHKVFLTEARGAPRPSREIKKVAYYTGSQPTLTFSARRIIDRFQATRPREAPRDEGQVPKKSPMRESPRREQPDREPPAPRAAAITRKSAGRTRRAAPASA
jgi:8-oxo-dGTP diphosphatase